MFQKVIGKTCKNPECELKDKLKEDFASMCDCGQALEEVKATDNKKVAIFSGILIILLIGGGYVGVMKLKGMAEDTGKGLIGTLVSKIFGGGTLPPTKPELPKTPKQDEKTLPRPDPKAAMILVSDGLNLVKENKFQESIDKFSQATSKDQTSDQAWGNLGAAFAAMGRHKDAIEPSSKATKLNPNNPIWHLNLAEAYSVTGDKQNALNELESAIKNGFTDRDKLKNFNFNAIQNEPKFKELVQKT